jgi:hypothetical protein
VLPGLDHRLSQPRRRRRLLAALAVAVTVLHLWGASHWPASQLGDGAADSRPKRIEVAFVRELTQAAPQPVLAAAPVRPRRAAVAPVPAASAAEAAPVLVETHEPAAEAPRPPEPALEPAPPIDIAALEPSALPPLEGASATSDPVPAALAASPAAAASAAAFEWPPSTRLTYTLTGNYRGPVHGQAQVEWLRDGTRYQVHMDVSVGPSFAPLMTRRVSSEGEITPEGLRPRRFDEITRVALRSPRHVTIFLDADRVRLPNGRELPRPALVQDSASQFVHLTWLFTLRPELLQPGRSVELPLALPRVVEPWTYDVLASETLDTPAGPVHTLHVKPRRESRPGGDLTAEMWVAPSLQYLPVRLLIRQDAETFVDLLIERLPEQAAPGR